MNAILVSVNFADILSITLPWNRHHFDRVMVVTTFDDPSIDVAKANYAESFCTTAFWDGEAEFAKWRALELGLDKLGRQGWICIMDADVLWPNELPSRIINGCPWDVHCLSNANIGCLFTPRRRMMPLEMYIAGRNAEIKMGLSGEAVPIEEHWSKFPLHRNEAEFAGYSQIFHASDPVLGPPPWHETDWRHCGGADSFFQAKWPPTKKIRPPWEVLHLGNAGENWMGRVTPYLDGSEPNQAAERRAQMAAMFNARRGKQGMARFEGERLKR